jgi:hypothetical protein
MMHKLLVFRRESQFTQKAANASELKKRQEVIYAFRRIHKAVRCTHDPLELLFIADFALSSTTKGVIVECGAFKGGSTSKLSILSRLLNKELHVFDSFEGLSEPSAAEKEDAGFTGVAQTWQGGQFAGSLAEVSNNVKKYGFIDKTVFHKGYFKETMPTETPGQIAFAFVDCDLVSPAQDCVRHIWPKLQPGGRLFFHDVIFRKFSEGITDFAFWQTHLKEPPPVLWGAGYGCGDMAPNVGFFEKY